MYDKVELSEEFKKRIDNTYLLSDLVKEQEVLIRMMFDEVSGKERKEEARVKARYVQKRIHDINDFCL